MPRATQQNGSGVNVNSEALIQRIIAERRAETKERAEQRRQRDLWRIQEMKSKTGLEPLEIFPREIWEVMLDKLGPVDKGNISEVHELFQNLMENTRLRDILFPQIIGMNVCSGSPSPQSYKILRRVSKSLREEVDRYHESYLLNLMRTDTESRVKCVSLDMWTTEKDQQNRPKCFFTRSLSISLPLSQIQFDRRKNTITKMLEEIGVQVLYLHFCWDEDTRDIREEPKMSIGQSYIEFNKFLEYMPNLKWLKLDLKFFPQKQKSLRKALKHLPPKKFKNLERIDYGSNYECDPIPEKIEFFEAVLKANPKIKILNLKGLYAPLTSAVLKSLPNLEVFVAFSANIKHMQGFVSEKWPLKRIKLLASASSLNWMFRFLEKFPSLEDLSMEIQQREESYSFEREVTYLRLPNLTKFEMYVPPHSEACFGTRGAFFFFSLHFLLYASKLKSLKWKDRSDNPNKLKGFMERYTATDKGIDFCGGWKDLRDSNIWDVFPDLDHVEVICTHDEVDKESWALTRKYRRRTLVFEWLRY